MPLLRSLGLTGLIATSLLLAGCSTATTPATDAPAPSNSSSTEQPSGSPSGEVTGADALTQYIALATDSCDASMQYGVVEESNAGDKLIMIPKAEAYEGFSAVWSLSDGTTDVIYETDYFLTCGDAMWFWTLEENGEKPTDYEVKVTAGDAPVYKVTRQIEDRRVTYTYTTKGGLIETVEIPGWERPENSTKWTVRYSVTDADKATLRQIVDTVAKN